MKIEFGISCNQTITPLTVSSVLFKMSALAKLQMIGSGKPYNGFIKLALGYHEIVRFRLIKNKYKKDDENNQDEKCMILELQEEIVFMPQYFSRNVNETDVISLNSDGVQKYLYFGGKREKNK